MIFYTANNLEEIKANIPTIMENFKGIRAVALMRHHDVGDEGYTIAFLQSDFDARIYGMANPLTADDAVLNLDSIYHYIEEEAGRLKEKEKR